MAAVESDREARKLRLRRIAEELFPGEVTVERLIQVYDVGDANDPVGRQRPVMGGERHLVEMSERRNSGKEIIGRTLLHDDSLISLYVRTGSAVASFARPRCEQCDRWKF